jgi:5-hydroxyisourate hydrolase
LSGISTHILDIHLGRPAARVSVSLERDKAGLWTPIARHTTDADGRVRQLLPEATPLRPGQYRLTFETAAYFDALGVAALYPLVQIVFTVRDAGGHYHIPLLLAANGYSTYRGS